MDDCQRCNMPEKYGCACDPQEVNKWRAEKIIALQARVAELEVLLTTARQLVTHAATELAQSAQDMSAMRAERALHKAIAAIREGRG
jgi:hypothetical protein